MASDVKDKNAMRIDKWLWAARLICDVRFNREYLMDIPANLDVLKSDISREIQRLRKSRSNNKFKAATAGP